MPKLYPRLEAAIAASGKKKYEVAKLLGLQSDTLSRKLRGRSDFTWPEVVALRDYLAPDTSLVELMVCDRRGQK